MLNRKKLQVFISSTYKDLIPERQAAVEAVLRAGHIPAGMELFSAGNESQAEVIRRWIDESDVYMLILGGRYGAIEPKSKKSYVEIEYLYALEAGKPSFAVVISDKALNERAKLLGKDVLEPENQDKYKEFRKFVLSKVCRFFSDEKDVKIAVLESLPEIAARHELSGWISGNEIPDFRDILNENAELREINQKLQQEIKEYESSKKTNSYGEFTFPELSLILESKKIGVPGEYLGKDEDMEMSLLELFYLSSNQFNIGVDNSWSSEKFSLYLFHNVAPSLLPYGLVEKVRVPGVTWYRVQTSALGLRFLAQLEKDLCETQTNKKPLEFNKPLPITEETE